ncbi:MAG: YbhB/YbcL family Raf kinase inhibitor-like protein [Candidatus Omnitrophica bacterium]|nr:YbhB/YbcL family Raf kinase inhibitor-like protein [Candidatus Omnitrophota bacterium]
MKKVLFLILFILLIAKGGFAMKITSPEFKHNEMIPKKFTCQGEDVSPTLLISDIPVNAKSLVLIVDDPDAPIGNWDHWIVYNIMPQTSRIEEGSIPGKQALNDFNRGDWGGPCPPSGTHRYFFKIYALNKILTLDENSRKSDVESAMSGCIIDQAQMIGLYKKTF